MIPSVVARQVRETILDYLRTTFGLADSDFERALFKFLDGDEGLFKGPYIDVRLPFRKAGSVENVPLDIRPGFPPYKHQLRAFHRLKSKDGRQPQNTLVTTGTGSGKTECFLYPILDHCWRNRGEPGIKAILLYPMNALASDQARRLAETLWDDERLRGQVTAGLYVGGKGRHGAADREHLVDQREVLRDSPPDVLLTNYKMLDFLLLRPEDRTLWERNDPDTLRYLVLDELHTYDGAQGTDVACLIRRLKARLESPPGKVCCVGTSATIGGSKDETLKALTDFASKVFNEDFTRDTVVTEERVEPNEALGTRIDIDRFPDVGDVPKLDPGAFPDPRSWLAAQAEIWLGDDVDVDDAVEVGNRLARHDLLREILKLHAGIPRPWQELDEGLGPRVPEWHRFDAEQRARVLDSFLALVSHARRSSPTPTDPKRLEPLLTVQVQLWVRELRHLVQRVTDGVPQFVWADERPPNQGEVRGHWLPIAICRDCGSSGQATYQRESEPILRTDEMIGRLWFDRSRQCRFLRYGHRQPTESPAYLCPNCLRVQGNTTCERCRHVVEEGDPDLGVRTIPIELSGDLSTRKPPTFLAMCPECGSAGALWMLGSRAPTLLSVAVGHVFQSDYNADKKLLAFTDSVQDASHRAGFFGARTYRFNLRTAMQAVLEENGEGIPLNEFAERMWEHWEKRKQLSELIPTLLPADLRELPGYRRFVEKGGAGPHTRLHEDLQERLSWEAVLEYGLNARVGRTLENTRCSTVVPRRSDIERAAEILALDLVETPILDALPLAGVSPSQIEHFLAGVLHRLRWRGGVFHDFLRRYVQEYGNRYFLTKAKMPLISPFGHDSVLPRFLTDRLPAAGTDPVFDTIVSTSSQLTWHRDWASRALGLSPADEGMNALYREALKRLEGVGLILPFALKKTGTAWGIDPGKLTVTREINVVACSDCRRRLVLAESDGRHWEGRACTQYRCPGVFEHVAEREQSYYARVYRSKRLARVFAQEHTGLLGREQREKLEEQFKAGTDPGAPNLFVCTPTLELGIDIGELSGTIQCSVPPTTANYLQRIGRAGRKTGNAFCTTVAVSRPHDLYFHAQPHEMVAGDVLPPGCFLDAPEMLRRQLIAFAMDAWARQEKELSQIPHKSGLVLGEKGRRRFPGRFLDFYDINKELLADSFLALFEGFVDDANRRRLREFALGVDVPRSVQGAFDKVRTELDDLRAVQERVNRRLRELEDNPDGAEDPEVDKIELEATRSLLGRLREELRAKYPLNVLTDEGVLPNYAFPEPGVHLESVVGQRGEDGKVRYDAYEYVRPASSAIRELAPFNTFYAEGRRVHIDEIDIGNRARPLAETWRLCRDCAYMERELEDKAPEPACPRCGDADWTDAGQARTLVHFRRSRSLETGLEVSTVDDAEDRESAFYELLDLIDVGPDHWNGAKLIASLPFGYELLKNLDLREINFGVNGHVHRNGFKVRGESVGEKGFEVCLECGRVRDKKGAIRHGAQCRARRTGVKERTTSLFLYRQIQSEAIRILLPVSEIDLDEKRASFKAALQLGFRRHFQGDPGHLLIKSSREPIRSGHGSRQYIVVYDGVPGGTGYLSELWQENKLFAVFELALDALQTCSCQTVRDRDGCYRCLYAYQSQRDLPFISSKEAQRILGDILDRRVELRNVQTLSEAKLDDKLESELETKFLHALRKHAEVESGWSWQEKVKGGELRWLVAVGEERWEIRAQVELGPADGVHPSCRPDFLISPATGDPAVKQVAVFCDGLAFHVRPDGDQGRIADDVAKRTGTLASGRFVVWSVTWKDVDDFETGQDAKASPTIFGELNHGKLGKAATVLGLTLNRRIGRAGSMEMLLAYLAEPNVLQWETLARTFLLTWLSGNTPTSPSAGLALMQRLRDEPSRFVAGPLPAPDVHAEDRAAYAAREWLVAAARCSEDALRKGQVDKLEFILRLFDERAGRQSPSFEADWRAFLQAWNLLQFHERVEIISSEGIGADYRAVGEPAPRVADVDRAGFGPELAELLEFATSAGKPILLAVAEAGLPFPTMDYELPSPTDGIGPEADLAWPAHQVAILAPQQLEDRTLFEEAGWQIYAHPVEASVLTAELRRRNERTAGSGGDV